MRSVENEECGKRGVWKTRSVENAECGKCGVWKMRNTVQKLCITWVVNSLALLSGHPRLILGG